MIGNLKINIAWQKKWRLRLEMSLKVRHEMDYSYAMMWSLYNVINYIHGLNYIFDSLSGRPRKPRVQTFWHRSRGTIDHLEWLSTPPFGALLHRVVLLGVANLVYNYIIYD